MSVRSLTVFTWTYSCPYNVWKMTFDPSLGHILECSNYILLWFGLANFGVLPMYLFPSGKLYFEMMSEKQRREVVVLHNNFVIGKYAKIHRFKSFQLWALDLKTGKIHIWNHVPFFDLGVESNWNSFEILSIQIRLIWKGNILRKFNKCQFENSWMQGSKM